MNCPECGEPEARTLEARVRPDNAVRRRRECTACTHRWTTLERIYAKLPRPRTGRPMPVPRGGRPRKLTDQQVLAIYHADLSHVTMAQLAERHSVSRETVRQIRKGKVYKKLLASMATIRLCTDCIHWATVGHYCTMGFPDPEDEGLAFASDCSLYEALTQSTSLD